jgi:hypothetical protein
MHKKHMNPSRKNSPAMPHYSTQRLSDFNKNERVNARRVVLSLSLQKVHFKLANKTKQKEGLGYSEGEGTEWKGH